MSLQQYTQATVLIDGTVIAENTSVKVNRDSKANLIDTLGKGYAGVSPGSKIMMISMDNAVPSADFEFNPGKYIATLKIVEITVFAAGRTLTSKGTILSDDFSSAVNSPSSISFSAACEFADWI